MSIDSLFLRVGYNNQHYFVVFSKSNWTYIPRSQIWGPAVMVGSPSSMSSEDVFFVMIADGSFLQWRRPHIKIDQCLVENGSYNSNFGMENMFEWISLRIYLAVIISYR